MTLALRLAAKGRGTTSPNPMVGALVVNRGRIVGEGYHRRPGSAHAEILALKQAGSRARGGTLYVTLEPCCHLEKRTPPCVPTVVASGVRRVVIGMEDPNPAVQGKGIAALRRARVSVRTGVARREAEALNRIYTHWIRTKRPYVTLKAGMTLDGKIATASGESRWITGTQSRQDVHELRSRVDAVLIGIGTVLADDPSLTARTGRDFGRLSAKQPLRVVADSRLQIPLDAKILAQQQAAPTLVATTGSAPRARRRALQRKRIEMIVCPAVGGHLALPALMNELGRRGITSLLLEGGGELNAAMLKSRLVDRLRLYIAPALLGGRDAIGVIGGRSPARLAQAVKLHHVSASTLGGDFVIEGEL